MKLCIDLARGQVLSEPPAGLHGHFSFQRFTEIMRAAGDRPIVEQAARAMLDRDGGRPKLAVVKEAE